MTAERVTAVAIGDRVALLTMVTAAEPCLANTGNWYCVTHQEMFANQINKDFHLSGKGRHVLAWFCHTHGLEAP